jgi:hypothetical protein
MDGNYEDSKIRICVDARRDLFAVGRSDFSASAFGHRGPVFLLTYKLPHNGNAVRLAITTDANPRTNQRSYNTGYASGVLYVSVRFLSKEEDRIELGLKNRYEKQVSGVKQRDWNDLPDIPEEKVWIVLGENREISVPGLGPIELRGEFMDHVPTLLFRPEEVLDPQKNELRIVSPVLIREREVVFNAGGSSSISSGDPDPAVMMYMPGEGRYLISIVPFDGAVEGSVELGQIRFRLEGQDYLLLTAMPTTRSEHVWVVHDPRYKLSEHMEGASDSREMFLSRRLSTLLAERMTHYSE